MPQEYVLVTTLSHFKSKFAIPLEEFDKLELGDPIDTEKLLTTLTKLSVKEFSQKHLGDVVADVAVYNEADTLTLFKADNDYLSSWSDDKKLAWIADWKEEPF
jgi:hypothetical protein